jgi:hypothetical protein
MQLPEMSKGFVGIYLLGVAERLLILAFRMGQPALQLGKFRGGNFAEGRAHAEALTGVNQHSESLKNFVIAGQTNADFCARRTWV